VGIRRIAACLAACTMLFAMSACTQPAMETGPLPNSASVPPQPAQSPVPTVVPPQTAPLPESSLSSLPDPTVSADESSAPSALPSDQDSFISYYDTAQNYITVPAILHHSPLNYSISYDTTLFVCTFLPKTDAYWHSEGNYLSFSIIDDLTMPEVLDGLRLQENIAMKPEIASIGKEDYPSSTLYLTAPDGVYRQFWVINHADQVLLVELSYDTVDDDAALIYSSQTAMLSTLTLLR